MTLTRTCIAGGCMLTAACFAFVAFGTVSEFVSDWRKAKRWARRNRLKLKRMRFGDGRFESLYVGYDEKNECLWMMPSDYGKPTKCVRDGFDGKLECYEPSFEEDAEPRALLTWATVWEVAKVVLLAAAEAGITKFVEVVLEKLKAKWGTKSGATVERVESVSRNELEGVRVFFQIGDAERDLAKEIILEIIRYAKQRGLRRLEDFHENDFANIRLSILDWQKKKVLAAKVNEGTEAK